MADYRTLDWIGSPVATAQASAPAGFTFGNAYQLKAAVVDDVSGQVIALILDDNHNPRAITLPLSGAGPFTFQ
jgi:hypothetical protein